MEVNLQVVLVLPRTLLIYSICIRLRTLGTQLHDEVSKQVKAFVETQVKTRKAVLIFCPILAPVKNKTLLYKHQ